MSGAERIDRDSLAGVLSQRDMVLFDLFNTKIDQYEQRGLDGPARGVLAAQIIFVQHALGVPRTTDTGFGGLE